MNIVLAHCVTPTIPMGLFAIADALERAGHRPRLIHVELERAADPSFRLGVAAARHDAALVGLTLHWAHQSLAAVELAAEVKRALPGAFVVAGGLTASAFPVEVVERAPGIDAVVRGEGEVPLVALADALAAPAAGGARDLSSVPNLVWRGASGAIVENPMTYVARGESLGPLRFARADLLARRVDYLRLDLFPGRLTPPVFLLCAGRGCSVNCTACGGGRESHAALAARDRAIYRPVESILADLRSAVTQGYRSFYVCNDPKPNGPFFFDLFERCRAEGLGRALELGFGCWGLPTRAFLEAARAAFGRVFLEISPETASEALRKKIRGFWYPNADLEAALRTADDLGIEAEVYFGFPAAGETVEDIRATRAYALRLARRHAAGGRIGVNVLALSTDPQSPMARQPDLLGVDLRARGFGGYLRALAEDRATYPPAGRPPWLQNYLFHRPRDVPARAVAIAGMATATEAALRARRPALLYAAVDAAGGEEAFERFLEGALEPLLDALEAERAAGGRLDVDDAEMGRLGIRALCDEVIEALPAAATTRGADGRSLVGLAREVRAREELLTRLHAPGADRRDAAGPTLGPAWFKGGSPARLDAASAARPGPRRPPRRREVAVVTLADLAPDPVQVLLTVDPAGREWGLELSPEIERGLALCDGARDWPEVVRALAQSGEPEGHELLTELLTYGAIE